jgi:hypothetical protein
LSPFDNGIGHGQKPVYGNFPYTPLLLMNTSLANTLNEGSISDMLISIQRVGLTLTDLESVDVETNRLALTEIRMACKSVADVINDLLAEDASPSASDFEDVSDFFVFLSLY